MFEAMPEWKHFSSGNRKAEGRMIHSSVSSGDLILYVPGFPGGGSTLFENRFSDFLKDQKYNQILLRHNGTRLNGKFSDFLLNREKYPKAVPYHDGDYIGGAPSSIEEWLLEPKTVLEDIGGNYTNITVVGHSFGAVAALHSLALLEEEGNPLVGRVLTCLCLAPAVGLLKEHDADIMDTIWTEGFLSSSEVAEKITLNEPSSTRATLEAVYKTLADRVAENLSSVTKVFVHVERDEYLRRDDVEEFMVSCGQNCRFVVDHFDRHDPRLVYAAHDMPNYPQQSMIDLIEGRYDPIDTVSQSDGFIDE